ncbi:hypothetical protein CY34DRAFT_809422 [Suillus luteus UH-Slu-Lm8-n1]|uniref:Uncharacterized protein n=1 Tax=Suillus luteus UH-Slu-Lm8-n1 TaxID=930992 RepID=A0A0D0A9D1_9AGAM|nr:hypothetical protein CY34DRAFT_809422 [Suillus luteus UH-Slu-Lm8-n1]
MAFRRFPCIATQPPLVESLVENDGRILSTAVQMPPYHSQFMFQNSQLWLVHCCVAKFAAASCIMHQRCSFGTRHTTESYMDESTHTYCSGTLCLVQ